MASDIRKFYTSDLHIGHRKLYESGFRNFASPEEGEALIRSNFNAAIRRHDILYILGDLTIGASYEEVASFLRSLNGTKIVIQGNHDNPKTLAKLKEDKVIANWHSWKGVHDHDTPVFLTHFVPLEAHVGPEPRLHLHGHVHGVLKDLVTCPLLYDVGVDANDFKPVSLDDFDLDYINAVRLGECSCREKDSGMLCTVCHRFVEMIKHRRSGLATTIKKGF